MVDHQTYRNARFELNDGTVFSGLGVQVSAVSMLVCVWCVSVCAC